MSAFLLLTALFASSAGVRAEDPGDDNGAPKTEQGLDSIESGGQTVSGGGLTVGDKDKAPSAAHSAPSRAPSGAVTTPAAAPFACLPHAPEPGGGYPRVQDMTLTGLGPSRSSTSRSVILSGRYLYVSGEPGLQTIDVSDPENMRMTADWKDTALKVNGAAISGKTLYVADWSPHVGLLVFDLSNPAKPAHVRTIGTPYHAWSATVHGGLLDVGVGDETHSAVVTYDISSPRDPKLIGTIEIDDRLMGSPTRSGDHLYVTHKNLLYVYEASDPAKPKRVNELDFGVLGGQTALHGGYLYVLSGGVRVLSLADPANPRQVSFWPSHEPRSMHFQGDSLIVPASGSGIYTLDVSDPAAPKELSNWRVGWPGTGHGGYPVTADGDGDYVFIGTTGGNNPTCADPSCACFGGRVYSARLTPPGGRRP